MDMSLTFAGMAMMSYIAGVCRGISLHLGRIPAFAFE